MLIQLLINFYNGGYVRIIEKSVPRTNKLFDQLDVQNLVKLVSSMRSKCYFFQLQHKDYIFKENVFFPIFSLIKINFLVS